MFLHTLSIFPSYTEYVPFIHWVCSLHTLSMFPSYTEYVPFIHWVCSFHTLSMFHSYTEYVPFIHWVCSLHSLSLFLSPSSVQLLPVGVVDLQDHLTTPACGVGSSYLSIKPGLFRVLCLWQQLGDVGYGAIVVVVAHSTGVSVRASLPHSDSFSFLLWHCNPFVSTTQILILIVVALFDTVREVKKKYYV